MTKPQKDLAVKLSYYMLDPLQLMSWEFKKLDKFTKFDNIHTVFKSTVYFYKSNAVNILMLLPGEKKDNKLSILYYYISSAKCNKIDTIISKYKQHYPFATFSSEIMCVNTFNNFFIFKEGLNDCLLSTIDNVDNINDFVINVTDDMFTHNYRLNTMINDFKIWCDSLNVIKRMSSPCL